MNVSSTPVTGGDPTATSSPGEQAALAGDRASLCRLLATLFRDAPGPELLRSMRGGALRDALEQSGVALDEAFFGSDIDALAERLAVDFAGLFLLPGTLISPHESVQLEGGSGLLRGPETAQVKRYYEVAGFLIDDATPMEPDHLSIELEFLGQLAAAEAEAWEAGDTGKAVDALRFQVDFLQRHLGRWAGPFLDRVERAAGSGFYREFARLTSGFVAELQQGLPAVVEGVGSHGATN